MKVTERRNTQRKVVYRFSLRFLPIQFYFSHLLFPRNSKWCANNNISRPDQTVIVQTVQQGPRYITKINDVFIISDVMSNVVYSTQFHKEEWYNTSITISVHLLNVSILKFIRHTGQNDRVWHLMQLWEIWSERSGHCCL